MPRPPSPLIAQLAKGLEPVSPLRTKQGLRWLTLAMAATIAAVALAMGLWSGPLLGEASSMFFVANALIGLVGLVAALGVIRMAGPRVGTRQDSARWLMVALAILPATAVLVVLLNGHPLGHDYAVHGLECFLAGTASGAGVAAALIAWLRRGAPVALNSAGFYTGVAAGALGSFAYGLSCPIDTIAHLGIWHVAPVAIWAALGRLLVPRWIRW
jgi:hypothetical protein